MRRVKYSSKKGSFNVLATVKKARTIYSKEEVESLSPKRRKAFEKVEKFLKNGETNVAAAIRKAKIYPAIYYSAINVLKGKTQKSAKVKPQPRKEIQEVKTQPNSGGVTILICTSEDLKKYFRS